SPRAGVMLRETLDPASANAYLDYGGGNNCFFDRSSASGSTTNQGCSGGPMPWIKLVRTGNVFAAYTSYNGINWTQVATSQTIAMAQNIYVGLPVCSEDNTHLETAGFDNVSISSTAAPAPVITRVS